MKKLLCSLILTLTTIGFVQAQEDIEIVGNGTIIVDGQTAISTTDDTDFGTTDIGTPVVHQFTINNTGTTDLFLSLPPSINDLGTGTSDWSTTSPAFQVIPAGTTTFDVTFNPSVAGAQTVEMSIVSSDPDESPYTFNIEGTGTVPTAPDMEIVGNGTIIVDGQTAISTTDDTDFGSTAIGTPVVHQFTINNTGTTNLFISLPPSINDLGTGTSDWSTTNPAFQVIPAGTTTFDVTFNPSVAGAQTVEISISSNDPDESPYTFNIGGTGNAPIEPDMEIVGNGTIIVDGQTAISTTDDTDFGTTGIGTPVVHQFTINNTGTVDLFLSLPPSINDLGSGTSDWSTTSPAFQVIPAGTTTFDITFNPSVAGAQTVEMSISSNDPDENPYTFNVGGTGTIVTAPDIEIVGNGTTLIDGQTAISTTDDTDFGTTAIGTPVVHQFTINNTGTSDLFISLPPSINDLGTGTSDWSITDPAFQVVPVGTTTFDVTFNPSVAGIQTVEISISSNDPDESPYTFNVGGEGLLIEPEMDVFGNGVEIADGDTTPAVADDTDYGQVDVTSGSINHIFTIENNGGAELNLTDPSPFVTISGANAGDFTISTLPLSPIAVTSSTTFQITFNPSAVGIRTATISIANDDVDENPYNFDIQGEGIDANVGNPLLITQYFEGTDANNNWIEVKNISQNATLTNAYHLALYEDLEGTTSGFISTSPPTVSVAIPPLNAGEVVLFRRSGASLTNFVNTVTVVDTEVCRFDGNDVILISSSNGSNCYNNRSDIMGVVGDQQAITWAVDIALIKGCGTLEVPTIVYDPTNIAYDANQYIELTLAEVDAADLATNVALGRQTVGPTIWTSSWDNDIPDKTKNAIINGTYNESNGSFDSCNLTVNSGSTINFNSGGSGSNYILVENDLTINGSFIIGDTESLVTVNPDATMSGNISKIEVTTTLNNFRDITYWSSPVNTTIGQAFAGVDPTRIFKWDIPSTSPDFWGDWSLASGTMTSARGYVSEAPSGTPDGGTHTVTFTGTPNNGTKGIVVGWNNDGIGDSDFNLIGNPYPSAINIDDFIQSVSNNDIDGTIWLWTHNTAIDVSGQFLGLDYATYNLTGGILAAPTGGPVPTSNIGSGQGFFVKSVSGGPVFFENTMRLQGQNTQFFRAPDTKSTANEEKDRVWLNVESSTGGAFNQILVGFFDNATDGHDRGFDGTRLGASWINFYSKIEDTYYAVQGLSSFNVDKKVALGFDTYIPDAMTYKISVFNIEGALNDNDLYLVDNELGITHDLKLADYEFDVNGEGNFPDRFTLQFNKSTLGVDDLELTNNFVVVNEENEFQLKSSSIITNLKVYDMMGRLLIDAKPNESEFYISTQNIKKGTVLILNATFDNGAELSKKAIRY